MLRVLILSASLAAAAGTAAVQARAVPATGAAPVDASPAFDGTPAAPPSAPSGANAVDDPLATMRAAVKQAQSLTHSQAFQAGVQKQRAGLTTASEQPAVHPKFQVNSVQPLTQATMADELTPPARQWAASNRQPLLILVSFAMPDSELQELATQAARIGAVLVLRGLVDESFPATQRKLMRFRQIHGAAFRIDPTLFRRFDVSEVPTFILPLEMLQACNQQNCPLPAHVQLTGDAGLDYVLDQIDQRASDPRAQVAAQQMRAMLATEVSP